MALVVNKKAHHEYSITTTYYAGVVLSGAEVKSLRNKSGSLTGSYAKIIGGEIFLLGAQITPYKFADNREYDPKRTRKLLLQKKEIAEISTKLEQKGWVLVPLAIEQKGRHLKVRLGLGRGKKIHEKRAELRQRDINRDVAREIKSSRY